MIETMTNHTKPTLLISNVLPARPGDEAYNNICMRLWDRLLQAALPTWNVIREYAQEDGAEGAALRAQVADAIIIMGGEDVHPLNYGCSQGYKREGRHWYRADQGQLALVDYAARTGTPLLGICRGMQIINTAFGGTLEQHIDGADGTHTNPTILSDHRFIRHSVRVETDSHLERALTPVLTGSELIISSAHHQRVARLPKAFKSALTLPTERSRPSSRSMPPLSACSGTPKTPQPTFPSCTHFWATWTRAARRDWRGPRLPWSHDHLPGN